MIRCSYIPLTVSGVWTARGEEIGLTTTTVEHIGPSVSLGTSLLSKCRVIRLLKLLVPGLPDAPRKQLAGTEAHCEVQKGCYGILSLPLWSLPENRRPDSHNIATCFDGRFKVSTHSHTEQ